jgi:hypothetical protein
VNSFGAKSGKSKNNDKNKWMSLNEEVRRKLYGSTKLSYKINVTYPRVSYFVASDRSR